MQLIFFLIWVIALVMWLTAVYFIRTQLRTIDAIRPRVTYIYITMLIISGVFFAIALMNIISYKEVTGTLPNSSVVPTQPIRSLRSTNNEQVF